MISKTKTVKLTAERLEELVREVIQENTRFKSDLERKQHMQKQAKEAEARRDQKEKVLPGHSELMKLGKGVLEEGELLAAPDTEDFVRIKATALHRLLDGREVLNEDEAKTKCNAAGYYHIDDILSFITRLKQAEKGKAS